MSESSSGAPRPRLAPQTKSPHFARQFRQQCLSLTAFIEVQLHHYVVQVIHGLRNAVADTAAMAAALEIGPYAVQDQFKQIFHTCGVRSRAALLALVMGTASN
jgi:hypothetical protein